MALFIESNTYTQDGVEIIEYSITADEEGGVEYIALENDQDEADAFAIARYCQINSPSLVESADEYLQTLQIPARYHFLRSLALLSLQSQPPGY